MKSARQLTSVGLLILIVLASAPAAAQQDDGAANVDDALSNLMNTAPADRMSAREAVEEFGNQAVQPLIDEVQAYEPDGDANYVANCAIALGNLGDTAATNALLDAMDYEDKQVAYQAARALGKIYSQGDAEERVTEVNGALAAVVYRHYPQPMALGAGIALAQVNGLTQRPTAASLEEDLYPAITQWMADNPDQLPPVDDQPWPLLLQTFVDGQQSDRRSRAREVLAGTQPLEATDVIRDILRGRRSDISDERWTELAELLGDITGVKVPQDGSRQERLDAWMAAWKRELKTRTGGRFRDYCWQMLEEKIRAFKRNPNDEMREEVNTYKEILLSQTDSPDQIPDWASETSAELLERPIELKQQVSDALQNIDADTAAYRKIAELSQVRSVANNEQGPPVIRMFAQRLVQMARQEQNEDVLALLSTILTRMSEIPIDLSKEDALQEWLDLAGEKYPELANI